MRGRLRSDERQERGEERCGERGAMVRVERSLCTGGAELRMHAASASLLRDARDVIERAAAVYSSSVASGLGEGDGDGDGDGSGCASACTSMNGCDAATS